MGRPSQLSVMGTINSIAGRWPAESKGYIIALPSDHNNVDARVRFYISHRFRDDRCEIMAGNLNDLQEMKIFPSYSEASAVAMVCEEHWGFKTHWGPTSAIRIVEVTRRPPIVIHDDFPINVLDALAQI